MTLNYKMINKWQYILMNHKDSLNSLIFVEKKLFNQFGGA